MRLLLDAGPGQAIWLWLIGSWLALVILQPQVHRRLQGVFYRLTGCPEHAILLYSLALLPGVVLHEASHWLVAKGLGVRTSRVSLRPKLQKNGTLRLGYVEVERVDFIRESLIGVAPLLAGTLVVLVLGMSVLRIGDVGEQITQGSWRTAGALVIAALRRPYAGIWLYLAFAISNAMFPSPSDRRAWPFVGVALIAVTALLIYFGPDLRLLGVLVPALTGATHGLASAFTFAAAIDLVAIPLLWSGELVLARLRPLSPRQE